MNLLDATLGLRGGANVEQLGRQFGLNENQVSAALSVLVPSLTAGFQRNMSTPHGLDNLLSALAGGGHRRYVDDPSALAHPTTINDGNGILSHILGSKDASRDVARAAASQSGLGERVLERMLPVVAAMMMGAMSRQFAQSATS